MLLINPSKKAVLKLRLARDLVRTLKRGHPWVFADALQQRPNAPPGTPALLLDKKGRPVARGFYSANSPLAFRVCTLEPDQPLNDAWTIRGMEQAISLRQILFDDQTSGYRLFNGEGDGLPGLICDIYDRTAVIQLDGPGPSGFWRAQGIAEWLAKKLALDCIALKGQSRESSRSSILVGQEPIAPTLFLENGVQFSVDIIRGQKTGFFLDQRQNRQLIRSIAASRATLNLFGYTGGFSIYAGLGGASRATTVDIAGPALKAAEQHWQLNNLPVDRHETVKADAFEFLDTAAQKSKLWELVIVDPPSFASSQQAVKKAVVRYQSLIAAAAKVTASAGLLAVSSCSSHIDLPTFLDICEQGISKARRRATVLSVAGQPPDHPTPLPSPEFRYLQFVLMRIV